MSDKATKRAAVLLSAALLAVRFMPYEASARSSAPGGCAEAPTSPLAVNVKDKGARGDGASDDTAAIQRAIDETAGRGGTILVPDGTYLVNAVGKRRLVLKSDMTLKLSSAAILKAIPSNSERYSVLSITGASNVTLVGGPLEGDREEHQGKSGEWGMGLRIDRGASHITISGVTSKKMWGDGFYVQGATDVSFCGVTADSNRRQGLSIIEVDGLVVTSSVFKNTRGTHPSAGIDLEPDVAAQRITNVRIENSKFIDNAGAGILIAGKKGPVSNVEITHNVFTAELPIVVKDAPDVLDSAICDNRQITYQMEGAGGLSAMAEPTQVVVLQNDCGDRRLMRRQERNRSP